MTRPVIGITVDNVDNSVDSGRFESNIAYSLAIARAGGLPVLLPQEVELADHYVDICDGVMLTGGDDARTESFGVPAHFQSRCIASQRQEFELAMLDALQRKPERPVLGICLGMQLMALHAGGRLNQHLPDTHVNAAEIHQENHRHAILLDAAISELRALVRSARNPTEAHDFDQSIVSSHHQAVSNAGRLRAIATSPDGVIEAIDDPGRSFYLGIQWHPERSRGALSFDLIKRFVDVCGGQRACFP